MRRQHQPPPMPTQRGFSVGVADNFETFEGDDAGQSAGSEADPDQRQQQHLALNAYANPVYQPAPGIEWDPSEEQGGASSAAAGIAPPAQQQMSQQTIAMERRAAALSMHQGFFCPPPPPPRGHPPARPPEGPVGAAAAASTSAPRRLAHARPLNRHHHPYGLPPSHFARYGHPSAYAEMRAAPPRHPRYPPPPMSRREGVPPSAGIAMGAAAAAARPPPAFGRYPGDFAQAVGGGGGDTSFRDGVVAMTVTSSSFSMPRDYNYGRPFVQPRPLPPPAAAAASAVALEPGPRALLPQDRGAGGDGSSDSLGNSPMSASAKSGYSPLSGWGSGDDHAAQPQQAAMGDDGAAGGSMSAPAAASAVAAAASAATAASASTAEIPTRLWAPPPSSFHPAEKWHRKHVSRDATLPFDEELEFAAAAAAAESGAAAVVSKKLSPSDRTWIVRFQDLKAFQASQGHCNVPRVYPANPSLASWVHNQRKDYKRLRTNRKSAMTPLRIRYLEYLGFEWNQQGANWDRRLEELKEFKAKNGHTNVPQRYGENAALGRWVNTQRLQQRLRKQGQSSDMTEDRYRRLSELGFVWYVKGPDQWMDRFHELEEYKENHGNCSVPSRYDPNRRLGRWVSFQRTQYRLKQQNQHNHLTDERMKLLEQLGFSWTAPGQQGSSSEASATGGKEIDKKQPETQLGKDGGTVSSSATRQHVAAAAVGARRASLPGTLETSASSLDAPSELMKTSASTLDASPAESAAELLKTAELHSSEEDGERMEDIQEEPFSSNGRESSSSPSHGGGSNDAEAKEEPEQKQPDAGGKDNGKKEDSKKRGGLTGGVKLPGRSGGNGGGSRLFGWQC